MRVPRETAAGGPPSDAPINLDPRMDAPPFHYNPSSMKQRLRIAALALLAAGIALYMGAFQWGWVGSVWDPVFGTGSETVLESTESRTMHRLFGIPDAVFGAWAYATEAVLAFAGSTRRWQFRPWLVLLFGLDVIPLGIVSSALVVLQAVSVGAWCLPCLVTAAISLLLVVMAYDEIWSSILFLRETWKREPDPKALWNTVWGRPSPTAVRVAFSMTG